MNPKTDCLEYITRKLIRTSDWRRVQAARFPADMRNERAAKELLRLATTAEEITDDQWRHLAPHYDPKGDGWSETVSRCARSVMFQTKPETFDGFVQTIIDTLTVTA
jgi:hypothetical protein